MRLALEAARDEAQGWPCRIICGFPDPEREAWVLAGFDPCDDTERSILAELHEELGFSPVLQAVRLRDKAEGAPRNIKRVVGALTRDDDGREERCWTEPLHHVWSKARKNSPPPASFDLMRPMTYSCEGD